MTECWVVVPKDSGLPHYIAGAGTSEVEAWNDSEIMDNSQWRCVRMVEADELERVKAMVERYRVAGVCEIGAYNQNVADYCREWEGRAEKAEAEVARMTADRDRLLAMCQSMKPPICGRHDGQPYPAECPECGRQEARAEVASLKTKIDEIVYRALAGKETK